MRVIENEIARTEKVHDILQKEKGNIRYLVQSEHAKAIERQRDLECVAWMREETEG